MQFYKVCVSVVSEKCRIDTEILPSLFMRCTTDLNRKDKFPAITHLKFLARDMSEQVRPPGCGHSATHFLFPVLGRESNMGHTRLNPGVGRAVLPEAPKKTVSSLFQLLERLSPWFLAPFSIVTVSSTASAISDPSAFLMTLGSAGNPESSLTQSPFIM